MSVGRGRRAEEALPSLALDWCCPHVSDIRCSSRINPGGRLGRTSGGRLGERGCGRPLRGADVVVLRALHVLAPQVSELPVVLAELGLDLHHLKVHLLDQHLGVLEHLVEAVLLALQRLDDARLQGVDAPHALGRELVHLAPEVRVRVLGERLAVLGHHVDAVVPLKIFMLQLVQAPGMVVDRRDHVLPVALVVVPLGLKLEDHLDGRVVRQSLRHVGVGHRLEVSHPLGRVAICGARCCRRPSRIGIGRRNTRLHGCSEKSVKALSG